MRATLSVSALRGVLAVGKLAVERRCTIPILEYIKLTVADGKLTATGTNLDVWSSATAPLASSEDGAICVSARFARLVDALPAFDTITLAVRDERLCIETPDGRASLIVLPAADHPVPSETQPFAAFDIEHGDLRKTLDRIRPFISTEETRYYLNGVCLKASGGRDLRFVSTDGHRLGETTHLLAADLRQFDAIVPAETVAMISRLRVKGSARVELLQRGGDRPDYVRFTFDGVEILSKLIDGKYPDYERVIPPKSDATFDLDRASWLKALGRVMVASERTFRPVHVSSKGGARFALTAKSNDFGDLVVAVKAKRIVGSIDLNLHLNSCYLAGMLAQHHEATVRMEFINAGSPLLLTSERFRTVLMPMRAGFEAIDLPEYAEAA